MDGLPAAMPDVSLFGSLEVARGGGSGFLRGGMAGALNFIPEPRSAPPRASLTADDRGGLKAAGASGIGTGRIAISLGRSVGVGGSRSLSGSVLYTGIAGLSRFGLLSSIAGGETEGPDWSLPTDATRQVASLEGWYRWMTGPVGLSADAGARRTMYRSTTPTDADDDHREGGGGLAAEWHTGLPIVDLRLSGALSGRLLRSTSVGKRSSLSAELAASCGWSGPLSISASARLSMLKKGEPMAGASATASVPLVDHLLAAHLSASSSFRRPTFNDLYWPEDDFAVGNPDLQPERSMETEAGIAMPGTGCWSLSMTGFLAFTDDLIRWEPGESGKWSPVNVARARRMGIEIESRLTLGACDLSGTLTLMDVTDNDPASTNYGMTLPYVPDCTFGLHADMELPAGLAIWISLEGSGIRFQNYSETSWLPGYQLCSTGLSLRLPFWTETMLEISGTNLLDREYEESNGYHGEPRTLRATLYLTGEDHDI
jgi:outer membrane receptor protein involved in Fe transport